MSQLNVRVRALCFQARATNESERETYNSCFINMYLCTIHRVCVYKYIHYKKLAEHGKPEQETYMSVLTLPTLSITILQRHKEPFYFSFIKYF